MSVVLDASLALAWCFEDEQTPNVMALLDRVSDAGAVAPQLWPLEVLSALFAAERRRRLDPGQRQRLADFLQDLPVRLDIDTAGRSWKDTADLAARFDLTIYDATYLELAQRLRLPLASLDKRLVKAAGDARIAVLGDA